jgi:hypothetical protein
MAANTHIRTAGLKMSGGTTAFAVVETVAVTLSVPLLFTTCAFRESFVETAQLAFGASVLHVK